MKIVRYSQYSGCMFDVIIGKIESISVNTATTFSVLYCTVLCYPSLSHDMIDYKDDEQTSEPYYVLLMLPIMASLVDRIIF